MLLNWLESEKEMIEQDSSQPNAELDKSDLKNMRSMLQSQEDFNRQKGIVNFYNEGTGDRTSVRISDAQSLAAQPFSPILRRIQH